jgi:hypothetical protein
MSAAETLNASCGVYFVTDPTTTPTLPVPPVAVLVMVWTSSAGVPVGAAATPNR